jgi:hypothetical protein
MMRQKVAMTYDNKQFRAGHDSAAGAVQGRHLDLVLQILGHEAARAIHGYGVPHADVNSMIRVVKPFNSFGVVLPYNASDFFSNAAEKGRGTRRHARQIESTRDAPSNGMKTEISSRACRLIPYL